MGGFVETVAETAFYRGFGILTFRVLLIVGAAIWIYSPAFQGGWIWDDTTYVTAHLHFNDRANLWKTWLAPGTLEDYYPIESAVLLVQWHFWNVHPLGYHLTNVFLHIISALLVWKLLRKIGVHQPWLGGLLFTVHPIMVESVAWMVELKNTLSLPPLLLAMCAYVDYDESRRNRDYFLALGLFLVAMLCKASVMMLPIVILLYAWWNRGRITWADLKASLPFLFISLLFGLLTARLQHQSGLTSTVAIGWGSRIATVGWEMVFCFSKFFWPGTLLPLYPSGLVSKPVLFDLLPWLLLALVLAVLWSNRKGWGRHALLGLGFFLINMAPVFAFALMNAATMIWTMDHVVYLPVIGLIGLSVAAWASVLERLPSLPRLVFLTLTALLIASLAWQSHRYARIFQNEEIFWTYTLQYNPGSSLAHTSLGSVYLQQNRFALAKKEFDEALRINPDDTAAYNDLGLLLQRSKQTPDATEQNENSSLLNPPSAEPPGNPDSNPTETTRPAEALDHFRTSLRLDPHDPEVHYNFANLLAQAGQLPEAMEQYQQALKINPDFAEAHYSLGNALVQSGRLKEAATQYQEALRVKPDYGDAHANLGNALLQLGQIPQAIEQYQQKLKLAPRDIDVRNTLGLVLLQTGHAPEAEAQFQTVLQVDPQNATAQSALAKIKAIAAAPQAPAK